MMHRSRMSQDMSRPNQVSDKVLLHFALRYLRPYRSIMIFLTLFLIVTTLLNLVPELLIRKIIDHDISNQDLQGLYLSVIVMMGVYIISWAFRFFYSVSTTRLGQTIIFELRDDMYTKLLGQSQSYFDKNQSGQINSKLTNDLETLSNFLGSSLISIIAAIVQLVGIVVIMLLLSVPLALISFGMVPLLLIVVAFIRGPVRRISQQTRKTIAQVTSNMAENISGAKVSKTFAREEENKKEFSKVNKANYQASMKATKLFAFIFPVIGVISAIGTAAILWYSGYQAAILGNPLYTVGLVSTFTAYFARFFDPVFQISMFYSTIQSALASLERVYLFLDEDVAITDSPESISIEVDKGEIVFQQVDFSYSPELPIFQDLNITIEGGKVTAIVGETGAGKSSFMKLIPRFYDISAGKIQIDNQPINSVTLASLREHIGLVPQSTHLFNTTILENLTYGAPDKSLTDVIPICKLFGIHDFINRLPDGYMTVIHEDGSKLSQGQRQLLSFARAMIQDPKILLLDEATSSLDVISELKVQSALEKLLAGRTAVIIAHRLSTIRNANRIVVMDKGKIVQDGTHKELLQIKGKYRDLYLKQFISDKESQLSNLISS